MVDDSMLLQIAEADYAQDVELHLGKLRLIRETGTVTGHLGWHPKEVLELVRWSQPENPDWAPGGQGFRGHVMRAFCCAVLLRAAGEPENYDYFDGENSALGKLLESLPVIGGRCHYHAVELISWRLVNMQRDNDEKAFFLLALLISVIAREDFSESEIGEIACELVAEEARLRSVWKEYVESSEWLLGLSSFDSMHHYWRSLGAELFLASARFGDPDISGLIKKIGHSLSEQSFERQI